MPSMPIRRTDRQMQNMAEVEELLRRALVGRLGTSLGDSPDITPLFFVYADGRVYFHSAVAGHKLDRIQANPRVCFAVDELLEIVPGDAPCSFSAHFRSAIAYGRARELEEMAEKRRILELITAKYAPAAEGGIPDEEVDRVAVVEIVVDQLVGKQKPNP